MEPGLELTQLSHRLLALPLCDLVSSSREVCQPASRTCQAVEPPGRLRATLGSCDSWPRSKETQMSWLDGDTQGHTQTDKRQDEWLWPSLGHDYQVSQKFRERTPGPLGLGTSSPSLNMVAGLPQG